MSSRLANSTRSRRCLEALEAGLIVRAGVGRGFRFGDALDLALTHRPLSPGANESEATALHRRLLGGFTAGRVLQQDSKANAAIVQETVCALDQELREDLQRRLFAQRLGAINEDSRRAGSYVPPRKARPREIEGEAALASAKGPISKPAASAAFPNSHHSTDSPNPT